MAVFFEAKPAASRESLELAFAKAIEMDPSTVDDIETEAVELTDEVAPTSGEEFKTDRFLVAAGLWGTIVVLGVLTELADLDRSSEALWAAAAVVFGVIVGFLGGEKTA